MDSRGRFDINFYELVSLLRSNQILVVYIEQERIAYFENKGASKVDIFIYDLRTYWGNSKFSGSYFVVMAKNNLLNFMPSNHFNPLNSINN